MLDGKVAIVTGGTRGIGYETVRTFLNCKFGISIVKIFVKNVFHRPHL